MSLFNNSVVALRLVGARMNGPMIIRATTLKSSVYSVRLENMVYMISERHNGQLEE